jgi:predicted RNA-binding protein with PUA-like domain
MNYFLTKTEPSEYSITDFERDKETVWDGVHNYAAIGFIKSMKPGDRVFIYHSMKDKRIVGEAEVLGEPYQNTDDKRFSWAVRLGFLRSFEGPSLADFKAEPLHKDFALVRQSRLSVMPVPDTVAEWINSRL